MGLFFSFPKKGLGHLKKRGKNIEHESATLALCHNIEV